MLTFYLDLLFSTATMALVLVLADLDLSRRPIRVLLLAVSPFAPIGLACCLLLTTTGTPLIEWAFPAVATLLLGVFCKSDRIFAGARLVMLAAAVGLCASFLFLVRHDYTADPTRSSLLAKALEKSSIQVAGAALRKQFDGRPNVPEGPVGKILGVPRLDTIEVVSLERQWHTPLTRLYRVRRVHEVLWCPGGEVDQASRGLSLRVAR